jgi:hypothetical protein
MGHRQLVQKDYRIRWFWQVFKVNPRFLEHFQERIIGIFAEANVAFYSGISEHLGAENTGRVSGVDRSPFQTYSVKRRLNNDILFGMHGTANFVARTGWYVQLVPQASQRQAVLQSSWSAIVAGGKNVLAFHRHRTHIMPATGGPFRHNRRHL